MTVLCMMGTVSMDYFDEFPGIIIHTLMKQNLNIFPFSKIWLQHKHSPIHRYHRHFSLTFQSMKAEKCKMQEEVLTRSGGRCKHCSLATSMTNRPLELGELINLVWNLTQLAFTPSTKHMIPGTRTGMARKERKTSSTKDACSQFQFYSPFEEPHDN